MKFFVNELKIFYYTRLEDFCVDLISYIFVACFIYWLIKNPYWSFFSLALKLYLIFVYEVFLWQLPFIYTVDISYRYAFTQFFNWLDAQHELLKAWAW